MARQFSQPPWEFFLGGGILGQTSVSVVRAAQAPSIRDLRIEPAGNGVGARCEFEGHGSGEYTLLLYLNRKNADGTVSEQTRKWIDPTGDGTGSGSTDALEVENGIYRATLVVSRKDGGDPAASFRDSIWYDVSREGDRYIVTPWQEPSEELPDEKTEEANLGDGSNLTAEPQAENQGAEAHRECDHSPGNDAMDWRIVQEADADNDALMAGECVRCGEVLNYGYMPNSAFAAFLRETVQAVENARDGETVTVSTQRWISFDQTVFDALARRPQVAVNICYRYGGEGCTVTIPAGTERDRLTDENGFCGFRYLDQIFGGEEIAE